MADLKPKVAFAFSGKDPKFIVDTKEYQIMRAGVMKGFIKFRVADHTELNKIIEALQAYYEKIEEATAVLATKLDSATDIQAAEICCLLAEDNIIGKAKFQKKHLDALQKLLVAYQEYIKSIKAFRNASMKLYTAGITIYPNVDHSTDFPSRTTVLTELMVAIDRFIRTSAIERYNNTPYVSILLTEAATINDPGKVMAIFFGFNPVLGVAGYPKSDWEILGGIDYNKDDTPHYHSHGLSRTTPDDVHEDMVFWKDVFKDGRDDTKVPEPERTLDPADPPKDEPAKDGETDPDDVKSKYSTRDVMSDDECSDEEGNSAFEETLRLDHSVKREPEMFFDENGVPMPPKIKSVLGLVLLTGKAHALYKDVIRVLKRFNLRVDGKKVAYRKRWFALSHESRQVVALAFRLAYEFAVGEIGYDPATEQGKVVKTQIKEALIIIIGFCSGISKAKYLKQTSKGKLNKLVERMTIAVREMGEGNSSDIISKEVGAETHRMLLEMPVMQESEMRKLGTVEFAGTTPTAAQLKEFIKRDPSSLAYLFTCELKPQITLEGNKITGITQEIFDYMQDVEVKETEKYRQTFRDAADKAIESETMILGDNIKLEDVRAAVDTFTIPPEEMDVISSTQEIDEGAYLFAFFDVMAGSMELPKSVKARIQFLEACLSAVGIFATEFGLYGAGKGKINSMMIKAIVARNTNMFKAAVVDKKTGLEISAETIGTCLVEARKRYAHGQDFMETIMYICRYRAMKAEGKAGGSTIECVVRCADEADIIEGVTTRGEIEGVLYDPTTKKATTVAGRPTKYFGVKTTKRVHEAYYLSALCTETDLNDKLRCVEEKLAANNQPIRISNIKAIYERFQAQDLKFLTRVGCARFARCGYGAMTELLGSAEFKAQRLSGIKAQMAYLTGIAVKPSTSPQVEKNSVVARSVLAILGKTSCIRTEVEDNIDAIRRHIAVADPSLAGISEYEVCSRASSGGYTVKGGFRTPLDNMDEKLVEVYKKVVELYGPAFYLASSEWQNKKGSSIDYAVYAYLLKKNGMTPCKSKQEHDLQYSAVGTIARADIDAAFAETL